MLRASQVKVGGEERYIASHGRKPRGRAVWLFELKVAAPLSFEVFSNCYFQFSGTYSDAKKAARKWAADNNSNYVRVMP